MRCLFYFILYNYLPRFNKKQSKSADMDKDNYFGCRIVSNNLSQYAFQLIVFKNKINIVL